MAFDTAASEPKAERTTDAAYVNACANHPEVRPHVGAPDLGELDLTAAMADAGNVVIRVEHGCFFFARDADGRYELHTMMLPEGRGAGVLPAAEAAFRWMFTRTDCVELVTKVAGSNKAAGLMARRAGFRPIFTRPAAWHDGSDVTHFAMTLDEWRAKDSTLAAEGKAFHDALEAAKTKAGSTLATHSEDEAHDRAVGAAALMAKAGNAAKAAWAYNQWARFSGYAPVHLIPTAPVFDIGDAVVTFRPELEILQCR